MTIHTFELAARIMRQSYLSIRDSLMTASKGQSSWKCFEDKRCRRVKTTRWSDEGVLLILQAPAAENNNPAWYLHLIITPAVTLGNTEATALFEPTLERVADIKNHIDAILAQLPCEVPPESLYLLRADLCQDRVVENQAVITTYMELLRKGYNRKWKMIEDDSHAFRCSNSRYQVTVYDKFHQLERCGRLSGWTSPQRLLRVETALNSEGIRHLFAYDPYNWIDLLDQIGLNGAEVMYTILEKVIPPGDYYSLDAACSIVEQSSWKANKRRKIQDFLFALTRYHVVDKSAIHQMENGRKRLDQLRRLGINPATIKARSGIRYLPTLYP